MDITLEGIAAILAALLGGSGLHRIFREVKDRLNSAKSKEAFLDISLIYEAMHDIVANTTINRVLILATHNGGHEIKPGTKLYGSVLYETVAQPFVSVKASYQNIPLDAAYVQVLVELLTNGSVGTVTDTMPKGVLKDLYEREGVKFSKLFYLADNNLKKI